MSSTDSPATPTAAEEDPSPGSAAEASAPLPIEAEQLTTGEPAEDRHEARHRHERRAGRHTRISAAWVAVFVGVLLGVALVDFIVENTRSVRVDFFSAGGRMPVAVALLAAALAGAAVVLVVGVCRTAQLRLTLRRGRRGSRATSRAGDHADESPAVASAR